MSSFDLIFNHPDVSQFRKTKAYAWMTNGSVQSSLVVVLGNLAYYLTDRYFVCSNWIVFTTPAPLALTGHVVTNCLKQNGSFTVAFVDAIMVL